MVMRYEMVQTDQQLQDCCQQATQATNIALDSEFIRQYTFYPRLALLQLYDGITVWLIDPLLINDWQPLRTLLSDPQINKILHAAGEDLTVLQLVIGEVPRNLWDTQIMAAFAGEPLAASYTDLVQRYLQVTLSKQWQRADWLQRPLPVQQLEYAASDAYYLLPLADKLQSLLTATPWRLAAVQEECQTLIRQRTAAVDQQLLYQRIKDHQKLSPRSLACLQRLTIWRFSEAIARNRPLGRIATDAELWQIAARLPIHFKALQSLALSPALLRRHTSILLNLVKESRQLPVTALPSVTNGLAKQPHYKRAVQAIKVLVSSLAEQHQLPTALLASQRQIDQWLHWHWSIESREQRPQPQLLTGWRSVLLNPLLNDTLVDT